MSRRKTPSRKSQPRPAEYVRTIQHLKEVQKEAGMLDLRDAANQGKKKTNLNTQADSIRAKFLIS